MSTACYNTAMLAAEILHARLVDWLPSRLGVDRVTITDLTPPSGTGYSSETLLFTARFDSEGSTHEKRFVARLKPDRPGVFPEYDIDLQHDVMAALAAKSTIPVPEMLWQEPDASVLGTPFFVMAYVPGRVPSDNPPYTMEGWILELSDAERATMHTSAHDVLCAIHRLDALDVLGDVADRLRRGLDEELAYYESFFESAARGRPQPVAEAAWEWVLANRPKGEQPMGLSWGDSRISNMLFDDQLHPAAVLDWEMVSLGDPQMDLGWWLFLDRHFTEGLGVPQPPGFLGRDETIRRWETALGRSADLVEFYEMYAGFRFAVVMMSLTRLFIEDEIMPPDTDFDRNNTVTQCLAPMLGMRHPGEQ
jgi:aminoglycoside phosphotransferase (APT) family kinase protein